MKHTHHQGRRHSPFDLKRIWTFFAILMLLASMTQAFSRPAAAQGDEGEAPQEQPAEQQTEQEQPAEQTEQEQTTESPQEMPADNTQEEPTDPAVQEQTTEPSMEEATETPNNQIQQVEEAPGSVEVRFRACPPGHDMSSSDPSVYSTNCDGYFAVNFQLAGTGQNAPTVENSTGQGGSAIFNQVPSGGYVLSLFGLPDWNMTVFCEGNTPLGNTKPYAQAFLTGFGTPLEVLEQETIVCDWYAGQEEVDDNSVTVYTWECLAETMYGESPSYYGAQCDTEHLNLSITLTDANGPRATTTQANGTQWDDVVPTMAGQVTVALDIPDGFGDPVVYCQTLDDDSPTLMMSQGGMVTIQPAAGVPFDYQCFWYNVPFDGGSVTVYKWDCMPGTIYGQSDPDYYPVQCDTEHLNIPITLTDANGPRATTTQANGTQWDDVVPDMAGEITIAEEIPVGYGDPVVYCGTLDEDAQTLVQSTGGTIVLTPASLPFDYQCNWYNIPGDDGTVTMYKWECPQGMTIEETYNAHQTACMQPMDNVTFTLDDSMGPRSLTTTGGMVEWMDVQIESVTVTEDIPPGYSTQPFIHCDFASQNNLPLTYSVVNNVLTVTLNHSGQQVICHWYNTYMGPGEITVYKWTCPDGYDYTAWNADPTLDCTEATNGVTFVLDQPMDVDLQTDTGDSINGAVYFGGLTPGAYTLNEIVPDGIASVFVYDCVGLNTGSVHPVPLSVGPSLNVNIAGGDKIVCHWMNVPGHDPDYGWMSVTKLTCTTATYVSDVDCEIYEGGQEFQLMVWNGSNWTPLHTATTNAAGQYTWTNLDPGTYRLTEPGKTACLIKSDKIGDDGHVVVQANAGTTVEVYNCGSAPGGGSKAPDGGKMPTKYPNTGVEPVGQETRAPAASLLGTLGLLRATPITRRTFLRRSMIGAAAIGGGGLLVTSGRASQPIVPLDAEGTPAATPAMDCFYPATPESTPVGVLPGTPVSCARGEVPAHIRVSTIEVDADIEILEIIGGEMEQPTGAEDVAWYKETARLGEAGNVVLAGHLNYWGVPEGVFFKLDLLTEGDMVELEGGSGETYRYRVEWTEPFPSDQEPPEDALGQLEGEEVITMITCGGEWLVERAEYDHRTLVRAVRDLEEEGTPAA